MYAPGLITGHSRTGIDSLSPSQFVHALIKGSAQLGCFPDAIGWRFIPVDIVARDIVTCMLSTASQGQDIYLDSTSLLPPDLMVETRRRRGFAVAGAYANGRQKGSPWSPPAQKPFPFPTSCMLTRALSAAPQFEWCSTNAACRRAPRTLEQRDTSDVRFRGHGRYY